MTSEHLTNEALRGICENNFKLAHYAIALGRYYIASGRVADLADILKEVKRHPNPNYVEELKEIDAIEKRAKHSEYPDEG